MISVVYNMLAGISLVLLASLLLDMLARRRKARRKFVADLSDTRRFVARMRDTWEQVASLDPSPEMRAYMSGEIDAEEYCRRQDARLRHSSNEQDAA